MENIYMTCALLLYYLNCTSNFADVASILALLRFDEYQNLIYFATYYQVMTNSRLMLRLHRCVSHIWHINDLYTQFLPLVYLINEIFAICCVCFWCLCYPDSRCFQFGLSWTAEAGYSDSTLMLKLVAIVRKVNIVKGHDCYMHITL